MLWQNLAALLNVCWEEEFIPVDWMDGIVVPLHKGGGGGNSHRKSVLLSAKCYTVRGNGE